MQAIGIIVAVHESESGTSRHLEATPDVGRFRTEADMNRQARPAASVADDPEFGHEPSLSLRCTGSVWRTQLHLCFFSFFTRCF